MMAFSEPRRSCHANWTKNHTANGQLPARPAFPETMSRHLAAHPEGPVGIVDHSGNQMNLRVVSYWRMERVSLREERREKEAGAMGTGASASVPISVRNFRTASHAEVKRASCRYVAAAG